MSKNISEQNILSDTIFNESIIPQGLIHASIAEDDGISFWVTKTNFAFNKIAQIKNIGEELQAQSVFSFLDGFNCKPIQQFYLAKKSNSAQFIYNSGSNTFNLSFKKLSKQSILFALQDISDFQNTRAELNEKKRQLKESQEIAHLGYWVENHITKKHFWSDQVYKILNEDIDSIKPSFKNYLGFVYKSDKADVKHAFNAAIENKTGYEITHKLRLANGSIKYISQRCYTNYDNNEQPIQSVGIIQDITNSEIIKEELKNSETIFRSVFDFAPIAIVLVNEQHKPIFCNNQFSDIIGYSIEEIYKRGLKDFTHTDDYDGNLKLYNRLFNGEIDSFLVTKRYVHENGKVLWAKVTVSAIKSVKGKIDMAIAMVQDISAEKKATEALVKSEYKYRTLIENANDGIGLFDYEFNPIIYNKVLYEMLGYDLEEYLKMDHNKFELFHPDDIESAKAAIVKLKNGERARVENRMRKKDGVYSYYSISYIQVWHDDKPAILIFRRDITKRKEAEQQSEEYKLFLETLMENLPVSLFAKTTPDFRYLYWNNTIERETGIPAEEAIGKNDFELQQFKQLAEQYQKEDEKLLKFGRKLESEHDFTNRLGDVKQFKTIKTLHNSNIGSPIILGISMDVSKLKEAEQQVEQSNQMLKEAQKIAKLGYWEYDVKKDLFFDNLENRQILGTENLPYFINANQFLDLLHLGDQEIVEKALKKCIDRKIMGNGIVRVQTNKEAKHVSINYRPVEDEKGKVVKLRGTCLDITRIRKSEMKMLESEKRLKQAEHIAKVGYWDYNYNSKKTKFSDEIWSILEVNSPLKPIEFSDFFDAVHDDDKINVSAQFNKSKNLNEPFDIEFKIITQNKNTKYIKAIGTFVKNQGGKLERSIGTFQDVTDLKVNEIHLEKVANQLIEIQNIANIGFIEYGSKGELLKVSDTLLNTIELERFDPSLFTIDNFIHEDDKETITKTVVKCLRKRQSYNLQYRLKLASGAIKFVNEIISYSSESKFDGYTRIIQDITLLKEKELTLEKLADINDSQLIGTMEYNLENQRYFLSEGVMNVLGLSKKENSVSLQQFVNYIHDDDKYSVSQVLNKSIKLQETHSITFRFSLKENESLYVQCFNNFHINSAGESVMFGTIRDISEHRKILAKLHDRKELFKAITENSLLGIVIYSDNKRVYANKKWSELIGVDSKKLNDNLPLEKIYRAESIELIYNILKNWGEFKLNDYSNEVTLHPLNAPAFTAIIYIKEIQYNHKNAFLILARPSE